MSSHWLVEARRCADILVRGHHCFLGATTTRAPWYSIVSRLWSSQRHYWAKLSRRFVHVRVHRNGRLSEQIDMSPPKCIGCDCDFTGQGSKVGCDNSMHPSVSPTVVSGNNSLTYSQHADKAVIYSQLLVLLFLFHTPTYVGLQVM